MLKVLFVHPGMSPFIQKDLDNLRKHFSVRTVDFGFQGGGPMKLVRSAWAMISGAMWADVSFLWFADIHALLAVRLSRLFGKKSIVIVGGYEVAKVPEIGYGSLLWPTGSRIVERVLRDSSKVLAVSEFSRKEILNCCSKAENVQVIHSNVECPGTEPATKKEELVITAGPVNAGNLSRKGLECFVRAASFVPDARFAVIGKWVDDSIDQLKAIAPKNVEFPGYVSREELLDWYRKARVYCQLSIYESFGFALAEAMCFGCVPVVTGNSALPEVVGDTGIIVTSGDPEKVAEGIRRALVSGTGNAARRRVLQNFSEPKRENQLVKTIDEVCARSSR